MGSRTYERIGRIGQFADWMMPPRQQSADDIRASRLLVRIGVSLALVSTMMCAKYLGEGAREVAAITGACIVVQILGLLWHRATGRYRRSGHLLCFAMWALFLGIATFTGGIHAPNLIANTVVIVLAPILTGRRGALVWLGAVLLTGVIEFILTDGGWVGQLPAQGVAQMRVVELFATESIVAAAAYFYATTKDRMRHELHSEQHRIDSINRDLRIILDNAGQGFLSLDFEGRLIGQRSAMVDEWLGAPRAGGSFADALAPHDPRAAEWFALAWDQVASGILPQALCLAQLPDRVHIGELTLTLRYRMADATDDGTWRSIVVIMTDVTDRVAQEHAAAQQRDLLNAFDYIRRDPRGFQAFLQSAREHVDALSEPTKPSNSMKRRLHTLKGNCAVMGLSSLAQLCHELEDELAEEAICSSGRLDNLSSELGVIEARLRFLSETPEHGIHLSLSEHDRIINDIKRGVPRTALLKTIGHWQQDRVDRHLRRLGEHAEQLAKRLNKAPVDIQIVDNQIRVANQYDALWEVLVHVVRNAIEHGLEAPETRASIGKGAARLWFEARRANGHIEIRVRDNGAGVDWESVRTKAERAGLANATQSDLVTALFTDGFTTKSDVSEISGRGVGLAEMRATCRRLGVTLGLESRVGEGTTFTLTLPAEKADTSSLSPAPRASARPLTRSSASLPPAA